MKTDLLACRHIGVNKADAEVMLRKIRFNMYREHQM